MEHILILTSMSFQEVSQFIAAHFTENLLLFILICYRNENIKSIQFECFFFGFFRVLACGLVTEHGLFRCSSFCNSFIFFECFVFSLP